MTMLKAGLAAAAALLMLAGAARAQETDVAERGGRSFSLAVGESQRIGYWQRIGGRAELGLELGITHESLEGDENSERTFTAFSFGPSLKLRAAGDGAFSPYTLLGVEASRTRQEIREQFGSVIVENESTQTSVGARAAVGLDWFPARRVSVGGHVGVVGGVRRQEVGGGDDTNEVDGFFAGTFTSGIVAHLYF